MVFFACAGASKSLPTAEQLAALEEAPSPIDVDALRSGRALAVTECATCHRFYWPNEYSPAEWDEIVKKMGRRASFDQEQTAAVTLYYTLSSKWTGRSH
ncbi:MAG: hypothetical protein C4520_10385 [Candidatus Abyssobacteria bacterium SURF_5]|uniref:Cytochrome c n=1 Tax=Abyssobacteria bacterium (strain SURF_5) TaxID=2093360 RepID=A0A3A4NSU9_ABYX5|nr:MAG: hypothetical protein C4520_10385 [Candidatus Abyssubacteria bacterium SURF_5]